MKQLQSIDKQALKQALLSRLQQDLATMTAAQRASQEGVTNEESRSENDKDMRSTETSYLARGQAERVVSLREEIGRVEVMELRRFGSEAAVAMSALVLLEDEHSEEIYFVAPAGGGIKISLGTFVVCVVTPQSPLGKAVLGKRVDDVVERPTVGGLREQTVVELA